MTSTIGYAVGRTKTGRYTNCKNWWSREVFDFDTQEGEFTQRIPKTVSKEDSEKGIPSCGSYWFYCMAPHLATVEYKKMVKIFMEEFGDDIDYVEPWDEAGWGLNTWRSTEESMATQRTGAMSTRQRKRCTLFRVACADHFP